MLSQSECQKQIKSVCDALDVWYEYRAMIQSLDARLKDDGSLNGLSDRDLSDEYSIDKDSEPEHVTNAKERLLDITS
jgi:hypothetical protein